MASLGRFVEIIDIRNNYPNSSNAFDIRNDIVKGLSLPAGQKTIPTLLLYDERGLRIYDELTTKASEYYLFSAEEEILKKKADAIVRSIHSPSGQFSEEVIVELGAGYVSILCFESLHFFCFTSTATITLSMIGRKCFRDSLRSRILYLAACRDVVTL